MTSDPHRDGRRCRLMGGLVGRLAMHRPSLHKRLVEVRAGLSPLHASDATVHLHWGTGSLHLDHRLTRSGSDRLTFHNLAPGRHRVEVILTSASPSHAATTFIVRAPTPLAVPVQAQPTTVSTPPPTSTTPPPRTPPPTKTATPPAPPQASPPQSNSGIPQGPNAGDGDSDNNGGPSDGDGNI